MTNEKPLLPYQDELINIRIGDSKNGITRAKTALIEGNYRLIDIWLLTLADQIKSLEYAYQSAPRPVPQDDFIGAMSRVIAALNIGVTYTAEHGTHSEAIFMRETIHLLTEAAPTETPSTPKQPPLS
jgi:hypothetical protein